MFWLVRFFPFISPKFPWSMFLFFFFLSPLSDWCVFFFEFPRVPLMSLFSFDFSVFWLMRFVLSISSRSPLSPWCPRRELPSALVRAVVAPRDLVVSKLPAIFYRYSRFSDARVFDFSFFLFWFSLARYPTQTVHTKKNFLLLLWDFKSWNQRCRRPGTYMHTNAHIHVKKSHCFCHKWKRLSDV